VHCPVVSMQSSVQTAAHPTEQKNMLRWEFPQERGVKVRVPGFDALYISAHFLPSLKTTGQLPNLELLDFWTLTVVKN
jgi:hypothetical protein